MSKHPLLFPAVVFLVVAFGGCSLARFTAPADRVEIRSVIFGQGKSPDFLVFRVTVDYTLASQPQGNVGMDLDFDGGEYTPVVEHRVQQGSGTVELLAECKRSGRGTQAILISLSEYPRTQLRRFLSSETRTVVIPPA
jgi:hypothetical protein